MCPIQSECLEKFDGETIMITHSKIDPWLMLSGLQMQNKYSFGGDLKVDN